MENVLGRKKAAPARYHCLVYPQFSRMNPYKNDLSCISFTHNENRVRLICSIKLVIIEEANEKIRLIIECYVEIHINYS